MSSPTTTHQVVISQQPWPTWRGLNTSSVVGGGGTRQQKRPVHAGEGIIRDFGSNVFLQSHLGWTPDRQRLPGNVSTFLHLHVLTLCRYKVQSHTSQVTDNQMTAHGTRFSTGFHQHVLVRYRKQHGSSLVNPQSQGLAMCAPKGHGCFMTHIVYVELSSLQCPLPHHITRGLSTCLGYSEAHSQKIRISISFSMHSTTAWAEDANSPKLVFSKIMRKHQGWNSSSSTQTLINTS